MKLTSQDKYIRKLSEELTQKELTKINKDAEKALNKMKETNELTDEDSKAMLESLKEALKIIRVKNKLTYTPKKYRKDNKLF